MGSVSVVWRDRRYRRFGILAVIPVKAGIHYLVVAVKMGRHFRGNDVVQC
jgi:hypothetical protein